MKFKKLFCTLSVGAIVLGLSTTPIEAKTVSGSKTGNNGTLNWSISGGMVFGRKEYASQTRNSKKAATVYVDLQPKYYVSGASAGQNQVASKHNTTTVAVGWEAHSTGANNNRLTIFSGFETINTKSNTVYASLVE